MTKARNINALGSGQAAHQEVRSQQVSEFIFRNYWKEMENRNCLDAHHQFEHSRCKDLRFSESHVGPDLHKQRGPLSLSSASNERPTQSPAEMGPLAPGRGPDIFNK